LTLEASGPTRVQDCPARDALQDDKSFTLFGKKSVGRFHTTRNARTAAVRNSSGEALARDTASDTATLSVTRAVSPEAEVGGDGSLTIETG